MGMDGVVLTRRKCIHAGMGKNLRLDWLTREVGPLIQAGVLGDSPYSERGKAIGSAKDHNLDSEHPHNSRRQGVE